MIRIIPKTLVQVSYWLIQREINKMYKKKSTNINPNTGKTQYLPTICHQKPNQKPTEPTFFAKIAKLLATALTDASTNLRGLPAMMWTEESKWTPQKSWSPKWWETNDCDENHPMRSESVRKITMVITGFAGDAITPRFWGGCPLMRFDHPSKP